jgi:hypothetical protein
MSTHVLLMSTHVLLMSTHVLLMSLNGPKSNDSLSYTLNDIKIKVKKLGLCKPFSYPAL